MRHCLQRNSRIAAAVLLFFGAFRGAFAQLAFLAEGIRLYQEQTVSHSANPTTALTGGGLVQAWIESDIDGVRRVAVQVVRSDGQLCHPENIPYFSGAEHDAYDVQTAASSDGGVFLLWAERLDSTHWNFKLQKLNENGEPLWQEGGVSCGQRTSASTPDLNLIPDSNSGCFTSIYQRSPRLALVRAFGPDGRVRPDWPEEGLDSLRFDGTYADPFGGFWQIADSTFNRYSAQGERLWAADCALVPPIDDPEGSFVHFAARGEYLFAAFISYDGLVLAISVYDTSGERVANGVMLDRSGEDGMLETKWRVTSDYKVYFSHLLNGDISDDVIGPIEEPWVMCYDPFSENHLPWGERGVQLEANQEAGLGFPDYSHLQIGFIEQRLVVLDKHRIYLFEADGGNALQQPFINLPEEAGVRYYDTYLHSNNDNLWISSGRYSRPACWKLNADAEFLFGEAPIWLTPQIQKPLSSLCATTLSDGGLQLIGRDPQRGLIRQRIDINGNLSDGLSGAVIDTPWTDQVDYSARGSIGDSLWLWQSTDSGKAHLYLIDAEGQILLNRPFDFHAEGNLNGFHTQIVSNGSDQFLIVLPLDWPNIKLITIDLAGERQTERTFNPSQALMIQCWPGQGWVLIGNYNGEIRAELLDDQLRSRWRNPTPIDLPVKAIQTFNDRIALAGYSHDRDRDYHYGCLTVINSEGELLDTTQALLFDGSHSAMSDYTVKAGTNGSFWYYRETRLQLMSPRWERLLGPDGLHVSEGSRYGDAACNVLPDLDGGGWVFWNINGVLKATHLDQFGRSWRQSYSLSGFNLFDELNQDYPTPILDHRTGRVWVVSRHTQKFDLSLVEADLRVQLIGDEWVGVKPSVKLPSASLILDCPHPNPFNSRTNISFELPEAGFVRLSVFDLRGRLVTTLVSDDMQPGFHKVTWDGVTCSAGVYLIRLEAGDRTINAKALLVN